MRPVPPFTQKLGRHASDTAGIAFEDVAVPDGALLGEEGRGFYLIVANFQWERPLMPLGGVGSMRANFELQDECYGLLADLGHPRAEDLARTARADRRRHRRDHEGDPGEDAGAVSASPTAVRE